MKEVKKKSKEEQAWQRPSYKRKHHLPEITNKNETQDPEHLCTVSPNIPQQDVDNKYRRLGS